MLSIKHELVPSLLVSLTLGASLMANAEGTLNLSVSEKAYVSKNQVMRLCIDPNWLPYEGLTAEGEYTGLIPEYMSEFESRTGLNFEVVRTANWEETWELVTEGGCDVVSAVNQTQARAPYLSFTDPYITEPSVIVTKADRMDITQMGDLKGKRLAVVAGYALDEKVSLDFPSIERVEAMDLAEGLAQVEAGTVDALAGSKFMMETFLASPAYQDLRIVNEARYLYSLRVGIGRSSSQAYTILNKAVKSLDGATHEAIRGRYAASMADGE
ncbi:MAG: transporter substrate-binding domain-containing protein [Gammaproteobacteria bacterium]